MNPNNQKVKRKAGALDGKIWAADDCWKQKMKLLILKGILNEISSKQ